MIARTTLAIALLCPLAALPLASAFGTVQEQREEPDSNPALHRFMEDLGGTLRTLGRAHRESSELTMSEGLVETIRLERALVDAKEQLPTTVSDETDAEKRGAAELAYRQQMQELMKGFFALENAYVARDAEAIDAALRDLNDIKKAGHEVFKP